MSLTRIDTLPAAPPRPDDAHKGTFGTALIIGGSCGMSGAAALSGLAALRGGAGLVFLAVPEGIQATVAAVEPRPGSAGNEPDTQAAMDISPCGEVSAISLPPYTWLLITRAPSCTDRPFT